jgi:predicted DNA-binding transcriptional regulator YafY
MYHPTTRVLAVLALLQSHRRLTGADMARRLEVNIRTLRRYITMLQDLGIPINSERGRNGCYELTAGHKLPPMMFTNDEAVALSIALLTAHRLRLTETVHAIESARAKLEQVMPPELQGQIRSLNETITLDVPVTPAQVSEDVLLMMSAAAHQRQRVHLWYRSEQNAETERDFDPYGLAYHQQHWYSVGYCHLRGDLRSFRLDRVLAATMLSMGFEHPLGFDVLAYLVQSIALLPRHYPFEILLKTDLITAQREISDVIGILEPCEGGVLMRGSTDNLGWFTRILARLSFGFLVRQPLELRDLVKHHAERLLANLGM